MNKNKKAIGYVCDIPVAGTDMVIDKEDQKARLLKYAKKEGIELIHIFEDDGYTRDFMNRPGLKKVLALLQKHDTVLVERVWALTRMKKELMPFLEKIEAGQVKIEATTYLWDYLHQMLRRRYDDRAFPEPVVIRKEEYDAMDVKAVTRESLVYRQGATMA